MDGIRTIRDQIRPAIVQLSKRVLGSQGPSLASHSCASMGLSLTHCIQQWPGELESIERRKDDM